MVSESSTPYDNLLKCVDGAEKSLEHLTEFVLDQTKIPDSILNDLDILATFLEKASEFFIVKEMEELNKEKRTTQETSNSSLFRWW